ncbi:MAG: DNA repair protein RecN [Candidatus Omnitrophica bacterium]|nr:DNA repair protein RecN [Candidatus Omnitrophota bacterium]MDD5488005.1 DNA repair protein RecN [Candidatus Omnitrophota bacterium]
MLKCLNIKNFGLIDDISIEFDEGLIVFTGETGAGKSILIDALRFALGARFNTTHLRDKNKPCIVEALFKIPPSLLEKVPDAQELLSEDDGDLIISRTYSSDGNNRNRINARLVTTGLIKELGDLLVDMHGPHDHQSLFSENTHVQFIDHMANTADLIEQYASDFALYKQLCSQMEELKELASSRDRDMESLGYQIKELEQVPLSADALGSVKTDSARANNAEKIIDAAGTVLNSLSDEDHGAEIKISGAFTHLRTLKEADPSVSPMLETLERVQSDLSSMIRDLQDYVENISFSRAETEEVNARSDIYTDILRKYGPSIEDAAEHLKKCRERFNSLVDIEHNTSSLDSRIKKAESLLREKAEKIHDKRKIGAKALKADIEKELIELGIKNVRFECRIEITGLNATGHDKVTFFISPNLGEEMKPLAQIVSSGEAARVMLALKKALQKVDPVPVLIFDEIDAQIGGRLGTITGTKLKELACGRQAIVITHLPQIAAFGNIHFRVSKSVKNGRTITTVTRISGDERISELAKMMSGEKESDIAKKHAHEMLLKALPA